MKGKTKMKAKKFQLQSNGVKWWPVVIVGSSIYRKTINWMKSPDGVATAFSLSVGMALGIMVVLIYSILTR
jgi:hypothetical protein